MASYHVETPVSLLVQRLQKSQGLAQVVGRYSERYPTKCTLLLFQMQRGYQL